MISKLSGRRFLGALLVLVSLLGACTKKPPESVAAQTPEELIKRGKGVYIANCSACHNLDPRKEGSIGPEVVGASLELLEYRIIKNEYPPGFKPKRQSHSMVALPHLKEHIPALHAYLNSL